MSNAAVYPVQLLNDLHNWFPEILYNPQRFQTVQDLIQYIGQVARTNPYEQGLNRYQNQHRAQAQQQQAQQQQAQQQQAQQQQAQQQQPAQPSIRPIRIRDTSMDTTHLTSESLLSSLLGQVFQGEMSPLHLGHRPRADLSSSLMRSFLNDTVIVHPTIEQLNNGTRIFIANNSIDNNCAVCQDPLEQGHEVCVINHCGHIFHKDCITPWFQQNTRCPTCRHDIRDSS